MYLRAVLALLLVGCLAAAPALVRAAGDTAKPEVKSTEKPLQDRDQKIEELQKELKDLRARIEAIEKATKGGGFPGVGGFPPGGVGPGGVGVVQPPFFGGFPGVAPAGLTKGTITKIDPDDKSKVTVSLGEDKVKVDQVLSVIRTKKGFQFLGMIKLTDVKAKESQGLYKAPPVPPKDAPEINLEVGDEVVLVPGAGFGPGPGTGVNPPPFNLKGPGGAPPGVGGKTKGTVSKFDKDKKVVTLTVTGEAGFKVGQMVLVMRDKAPPQFIGMIKITEATGKQITAEVVNTPIPGATGVFEAEEEVSLIPAPTGFGGAGGAPPFGAPPGGGQGFGGQGFPVQPGTIRVPPGTPIPPAPPVKE